MRMIWDDTNYLKWWPRGIAHLEIYPDGWPGISMDEAASDQTTSHRDLAPWPFDWAQLADIAELPEEAEIIDAREVGSRGTDLGNCMEIDCTSSIDGDSMTSDDELCISPELAVASGGA